MSGSSLTAPATMQTAMYQPPACWRTMINQKQTITNMLDGNLQFVSDMFVPFLFSDVSSGLCDERILATI